MKSMKELQKTFNKEEKAYKEELNRLSRRHEELMKNVNNDLSFEDFKKYIELAMIVCEQMSRLDSKHKKSLLKWYKKFRRRTIVDLLFGTKGE